MSNSVISSVSTSQKASERRAKASGVTDINLTNSRGVTERRSEKKNLWPIRVKLALLLSKLDRVCKIPHQSHKKAYESKLQRFRSGSK